MTWNSVFRATANCPLLSFFPDRVIWIYFTEKIYSPGKQTDFKFYCGWWFLLKIKTFDCFSSFEHFARNQETLRITRPQGENKHGDPIFILQVLNVL